MASPSSQTMNGSRTDETGTKIHPTSRWQEPEREDDLTRWEIHRKPRLLTQNQRIHCPLKQLYPHFRCVICLEYLQETTIVMVCLHRFCGDCINKCIRIGMKECPSCRKPIPSRRSLRRDTKFDLIVSRIVGSPADRKAAENQRGQAEARSMVQLQKAIMMKKDSPARALASPPTQMTMNSPDNVDSLLKWQRSPLVELELRRHPREDRVAHLKRQFLTIRRDAKVSVLKTFLRNKLGKHSYEISSTHDDEPIVLDSDLILSDAKDTLFPGRGSLMVLKYRISQEAAVDTMSSSTNGGRTGGDDVK